MGKQRIYLKHGDDDDDLKAINPSCMWGLMNAVDYHQWGYSVKKMMLPYKGNHVKLLKEYQIPKYDYDEQQDKLLQEGEEKKKKKKKEIHIDNLAKKNGSIKIKSIKSRLKSLLANRRKHTKDSSRRKLKRTYSIHHLGDEDDDHDHDHDHEEKHSNWDRPVIIIPGKKPELNMKESREKFMKSKENRRFVDVLEMVKVEKRLFLEIMKNSNDGISKSLLLPTTTRLMKSGSFSGSKLMKSGSFPGSKPSIFNHSKLKDKQSFLNWEKFPNVVSFKDESSENFKSIKLGRALSKTESNQEEEFKLEDFTTKKNVFSHNRSISLNESIDKYISLFGNDFKKEGKLHQSRSLRLRNEDEKNPRLFSKIGSLSNIDLYNSIQYEEPNFADWPVTFSEEINDEDLKVDHDHTYEQDDLARFRTESFSGECGFRVEDLEEQYDDSNSNIDICSEKNTVIKDDEYQESCIMSESSIQNGVAMIDDFKSDQGVENDDNIEQTHNTEDQTELEYIKHILEFSGISKNTSQLKWQSSDQPPLKPCLFDEACRPEDFERFTDDLQSFYHYQLRFDLINEELIRLNQRLSTYYPKALSYSCHVVLGNGVVFEEMISRGISKLMEFKPEDKPWSDSVIEFDLKKNDENWMNLQWESEFVALEVNHMIFEDLLNEFVC